MIRNILLSAIASLKRKKMASLFTILTISLGMTMIVLLASLYHSYTGNVGPYIHRDRCLYLSNLEFGKEGKIVSRIYPDCKDASVGFIDKTLKKIETPCMVGFYGRIKQQNLGLRYSPYRIKTMETDANFWRIHRFNFIDGKPFSEEDIANKANVAVISRMVARHFFGDEKAIGKTVVAQKAYRVVGVIEDVNPHFEVGADFYSPYSSSVYREDESFKNENGAIVFPSRGAFKGVVLAQRRSDLNRIKKEFNGIIAKMNQTGQVEEFDKVDVSLKSVLQLIHAKIGSQQDNIGLMHYIVVALIFLLLPLIILSNVNLYALRERLEEIGLRRSFGARRKDIVRQFFVENIFVTAIGSILALFLANGLNHLLAYILYRTTEIPGLDFNLPLFFYLVIGIAVFGLVTIVVPVWRTSRIQPVIALHQNDSSHSTFFHFRRRKKLMQLATNFLLLLVLLLCCVMLVFIVDSVSPLGYETKNVMTLMVNDTDQKEFTDQYNSTRFEGYRESLLRIPGVEKVSYVMESLPFSVYLNQNYPEYLVGGHYAPVQTVETDSVFFDLLEIKAVKGQLYSSAMVDGHYIPAITTLAGEKDLFKGNAVGQVIQRKSDGQEIKIIGVIKKYKDRATKSEFKGLMVCRNKPSRSVLYKVSPNAKQDIIYSQVINVINNWKGTRLNLMFDSNIDLSLRESMKQGYSILYAIILTLAFLFLNVFLGYLTLNYYNVQTRKREIGVRRATGASKIRVLASILAENIIMMLIVFPIAVLIIWQFLYLTGFPDWNMFFQGLWLCIFLSLLLTIGSALLPAYIASKVQPVEALGEE